MNLARLIYISDFAVPMTDGELSELISHSNKNNSAADITGLLICGGGHFMQLLEGEGTKVANLYARIARDPRHKEVQCLLHKQTRERLFPNWGMQLATTHNHRPLDRERIHATLIRLRLAKFEEPATEAITLLHEFRDQLLKRPAVRLPMAS